MVKPKKPQSVGTCTMEDLKELEHQVLVKHWGYDGKRAHDNKLKVGF